MGGARSWPGGVDGRWGRPRPTPSSLFFMASTSSSSALHCSVERYLRERGRGRDGAWATMGGEASLRSVVAHAVPADGWAGRRRGRVEEGLGGLGARPLARPPARLARPPRSPSRLARPPASLALPPRPPYSLPVTEMAHERLVRRHRITSHVQLDHHRAQVVLREPVPDIVLLEARLKPVRDVQRVAEAVGAQVP